MAIDLPSLLLEFIERSIPTYQAAELLIFLAANPEQSFRPEEIVVAMRPIVITVPAVREYVAVFKESDLVLESNGLVRYGPASGQLEQRIAELVHAYNERPVSLVAAIYRITDRKIRSFADSFKIRGSDE